MGGEKTDSMLGSSGAFRARALTSNNSAEGKKAHSRQNLRNGNGCLVFTGSDCVGGLADLDRGLPCTGNDGSNKQLAMLLSSTTPRRWSQCAQL